MGNAKKRRQVAKLLKEQGFGRLYKGCKLTAYKTLPGWRLDRLIKRLQVKPGDVINDCDGFNHRVVGHKKTWLRFGTNTLVAWFDQFIFEDGRYSCGCGLFEAPYTPEEIRRSTVDYWQEAVLSGDESWMPKDPDSPYRKWKRGEKWEICDEEGFRLKS